MLLRVSTWFDLIVLKNQTFFYLVSQHIIIILPFVIIMYVPS